MMCRGCSTTEPATTKIQVLTDQVKEPQLEEKAIRKYSLLKAVEFNSQLVTGTNYFVKVQVDDDNFLHLRVFENFRSEKKPLALHDYQTDKTRNDQLTYF